MDCVHVPAGCRLGFRKPGSMNPVPHDRNLHARDLHVVVGEPPVLGGSYDRQVWGGARHDDAILLREERISPREERRFFERGSFAGHPDISWFTLVVRVTDGVGETEWFGQLDFQTSASDARARARDMMEAIVASVTVRPALSVTEMLREHGIGADLTGLHVHHFGDKLTASLRAPTSLGERWTNRNYISMPAPPAPFLSTEAEEDTRRALREAAVDQARALLAPYGAYGPISEWTSNGIVWFAPAMHPLSGTKTFARNLEGYGSSRHIRLTGFCEADERETMDGVCERLARSMTLDG